MAAPLHAQTHPDLDVPGCDGCKFASVGFKYTYGKETWRNSTIRSFAEREFAIAEKRGQPKPEPIGTRWV